MELQTEINNILAMWPDKNDRTEDVSKMLLTKVRDLIKIYPNSAKLFCIKGDLEQFVGAELGEIFDSYMNALRIDPFNAEALESVGYYHYTYRDDPLCALKYFFLATHFAGSCDSYIGIARAFCDIGARETGKRALSEPFCPFASHDKIRVELNLL